MIVYAMDKNMYVRACPWTVRGVNGALKTLIKSVVRDTKGPCPWISAIFASTGRKKVNEINTRLRHGHGSTFSKVAVSVRAVAAALRHCRTLDATPCRRVVSGLSERK